MVGQTAKESESLTDAIRQAYKRAYRQGVRDRSDTVAFVYEEIADWRTKPNTEAIWFAYISRMAITVAKPRNSRKQDQADAPRFHFYDNLEQRFPIHLPEIIDKKTGNITRAAAELLVELGDFGLDEINAHDEEVEDNFGRVAAERIRWQQARNLIVPLLKRNKSWKWRDAVDSLREKGRLPDLERV